MVVAVLRGGIGNQLFIYAAAYSLAKRLNLPLYVDHKSGYFNDKYKRKSEIEVLFKNIRLLPLCKIFLLKLASKELKILFLLKILLNFEYIQKVDESNFFEQSKHPKTIYYLLDYFQSEKYFLEFSKEICDNIRKFELPVKYNQITKILKSGALTIHGRLKRAYDANGRAVTSNVESKQLNGNYFLASIKYFIKLKNIKNLVLFSDAPSEFEKLFKGLNINLILVDSVSQGNTVEELILMSKGNNYVISNSTFSWWGAYLSEEKDKFIVAPPENFWESDLPKSWHIFIQ